MMNKLVLLLSLLLPLNAYAEVEVQPEENLEWYKKDVQCGTVDEVTALLKEWNETPVFAGSGLSLSQNGVGTRTLMVFAVNGNTDSWTIVETTNESLSCIIAFGQGVKVMLRLDDGIQL